MKQEFTKYERARILGARALQISMDAPLLMKVDEKKLEALNYDPLRLAEAELDSGVLPIAIDRPMPDKNKEKLHELTEEEIEKARKEKEAAENSEENEDSEIKKESVPSADVDMKPDEELEEELEESDSGLIASDESSDDD